MNKRNMTKDDLIISLCNMVNKLTDNINKTEDKPDVHFTLIGVRKELIDIITGNDNNKKG